MALVCVQFSRGSGTRGGQAPALRARKDFSPNGPEEMFFAGALAGDRPPRYGPGRILVLTDLKRCFSRVRSRGTGPRATGPEGILFAMHPFGIRRSRTTVSGARVRSRGTGPRATDSSCSSCKSCKSCSSLANRANLVNPAQKSTVHPQSRGPVAWVKAASGGCRGQSSWVSLVS